MKITNESLDAFRDDFEKTVKSLEEKYDVTIEMGRITYGEQDFRAKITITNGRSVEEVERNKFDAEVWRYEHLGLQKGMYNRLFRATNGKIYAIRGFNPQAKKYPINVRCISDGEDRICNERFIAELMDIYHVD